MVRDCALSPSFQVLPPIAMRTVMSALALAPAGAREGEDQAEHPGG